MSLDKNIQNIWIKDLKTLTAAAHEALALLWINVDVAFYPRDSHMIYFSQTSHTSSKKFWTGAFQVKAIITLENHWNIEVNESNWMNEWFLYGIYY